jgi:hypothetical protein
MDTGFALRAPRNDGVGQGSVANRKRPAGLSVRRSKVRTSSAPAVSMVTAMRSSLTAVDTMRAPFGSMAVTSAWAALPSLRKTR